MSLNRWVGVGRITKDPVLRKTQSGTSVVSFILACNRRVKQDGQQDADFINCVAWNKTADFMVQYVKKGNLLGVEGRIQTRNYDDRDGKRVYVTEVVAEHVQFIGGKKENDAYVPPAESNGTQEQENYDAMDSLDIASDDLPF